MSFPSSLLSELPALLVIAEEAHFGRAAERLNVTQPRISQIVRRVEDVVGYTIFSRRPRVQLTAAGRLLIEAAHQALLDLNVGLAKAQDAAAGRRGTVRLGYAPVVMMTKFPQILRSFRARNSLVELQLHATYSSNLWEDFEAGNSDLIVSREAHERYGIRNFLFARDSVVAALPEDDPVAHAAEISVKRLENREFVTSDEAVAPQWHQAVRSMCRSAGFEPKVTQRCNDWAATLALVSSGLGVSLVSSTLAQLRFPGVTFVQLKEAADIGSFWVSTRENPHPLVAMMLDELVGPVVSRYEYASGPGFSINSIAAN